jgi:hypothetical protein
MSKPRSRIFGRAIDRVAAFLESNPLYPLTFFFVAYAISALAHSVRLFWYDELFTHYVSLLPSFSGIWAAMMDGLDFNPPLLYVFTRWSYAVFGHSQVAARVPSMVAFLVMCLGIWVFVRRRCGFLYALAAMWIPCLTEAFGYASEARPYALVLAFSSLALVFWQSATEPGRRNLSLAGFAAALACALLSHCYAILVLVPFGLGELARFIKTRRPDWKLWFAFIVPLSSILLYVPMLHNLRGYVMNSVSFLPSLAFAPRFYSFLLSPPPGGISVFGWNQAIWPLLIALVIVAVSKRGNPEASAAAVPKDTPVHEMVCLAGFVFLPFVGQLFATTISHSFIDRYALPAVIGVACLLPLIGAAATAGNRRVALGLATLFSLWFVTTSGVWFARLFQQHPYDLPKIDFASVPKDLPIVISDPILFLEANYKEKPAIAARFRFVTERSSALRYTGTDLFDRGYYTMERWLPIRGKVFEFSSFVERNPHFLIYGPFADPEDWLIPRITTGGFDIRYLGQYSGRYKAILLDVTARDSDQHGAIDTQNLTGDIRR